MSVKERGFAHIIRDLGGNKRSWESQPPWVNDGSQYVPYIYSRDEAKKSYRVQVGLVGAVIYDTGVVKIYDPELKEVRVKGEEWELWSAGKKAILNTPITWSVVEDSSGVYITREQTTSKPDGILRIVYGFIVGAQLKHTVTWISSEKIAVTVQVKQIHLMDYTKVTTQSGVSMTSKSEKTDQYLFGNGAKGFWVLEDQQSMVYDQANTEAPTELLTDKCLISGDIDFAGKKVIYTFGDWTLTTGQSLTIDPATATIAGSNIEVMIDHYWGDGLYYRINNPTSGDYFRNYVAGVQHGYQTYIEWNTITIPDSVTITAMEFRYNGNSNTDSGNPGHVRQFTHRNTEYADTDAGNSAFYSALIGGTSYYSANAFPVVATNQSVTLPSGAYADLQGRLGVDWYALALTLTAGGAHKSVKGWKYTGGATPVPTLYVEYTLPPIAKPSSIVPLMMTLLEEGVLSA